MRVYILDRDIALQAKILSTAELLSAMPQVSLILDCWITPDELLPIGRLTLMSIPEVAMWEGHEAALFEYLSVYYDELIHRVNTRHEDRKLQATAQKHRQTVKRIRDILFAETANNYAMTFPFKNASDELIKSHQTAFVAEMPWTRIMLFPGMIDLSIPYMTDLTEPE